MNIHLYHQVEVDLVQGAMLSSVWHELPGEFYWINKSDKSFLNIPRSLVLPLKKMFFPLLCIQHLTNLY